MSDSPTSARIERDIPRTSIQSQPSGYETYIGWSITEIRLQIKSWNTDRVVRKLAGVDGLDFAEPLVIESIGQLHEDNGGPEANFTVWSPNGWMFSISVPEFAQGGRPLTVTIFTEFPR